MADNSKFIDANRQAWDSYTPIHLKSGFYDLRKFGITKNSLKSTEIEEMGNVKDKSILHLQCHFGQDTLSLANMGARTTGVDFSKESISQARALSDILNIKSNFIQSDIYNLQGTLSGLFDIVFTSYGVLFWLPDLVQWANIIHSYLKPGGIFYIIEFHPFLDTLDEDLGFFKYPYFGNDARNPIAFNEKGTYADPEADIETTTYGWSHSLDEIMTALISGGLQIEFFHEFPFSHYNIHRDMIAFTPEKFYHKDHKDSIPYMYSIMARKT